MTVRPSHPSRHTSIPRSTESTDVAAPLAAPAPDSRAQLPAPSRKARWTRRRIMLGTAALLVLLGAALLTFLLTATTVTLRTSTAAPTNDRTPTLRYSLTYPGDVRADDVTVRVDGDEHSPRLVRVGGASEQIAITLAPLTDGTHRVEVVVAGAGILPRTQTSVTSLTIDTVAPALQIVTAPNGDADDPYVPQDAILFTKRPAQISVAREQGSELQVSSSIGDVSMRVGGIDARRERISVPLADGIQVVRLTAIDNAGNSTSRSRSVVVDTKGPSLPRSLPRRATNAQLALALPAQDPHGVTMTASLNGVELEDAITAPAPVSAIAAGAQELPSPTNGTWKIATEEPVLEGRHRLQVKATDTLDQSTTTTYTLLVDSTESLSQTHGLRAGARGRDVVELQQALIADGGAKRAALASEMSQQTYGRATASAVSAFQNSRGMSADAIAGQDTIAALTMRIVVDRASHTLTLYQRGKIAKTYGIAVGSPTYPTPAGSFEIVSMQMHPTWTPPDSDWAKDAEVIPPGPDNPLGTRWMGLSAPGGTVGIHGTNSPASIGYSVSHGCIRMAIPDVEDLYDRVATGTPVEIR